tara:strand:+ start:366 stop:1166 length:801 start_codon:yes stop_codon:yes gene_type:complete
MTNYLNLANQFSQTPNLKRTLEGLSHLPLPKYRILKTPLIIASLQQYPWISFETSYFNATPVSFLKQFISRKEKPLCFFIICNSFMKDGKTFDSHMLLGIWHPVNGLVIIDPNGNTDTNNSIYGEYGRVITRDEYIKNTLYLVLYGWLKQNISSRISFYTGTPISCSTITRSCGYRCIMLLIGLNYTDDHGKAIQYAQTLAKHHAGTIKEFVEMAFKGRLKIKSQYKGYGKNGEFKLKEPVKGVNYITSQNISLNQNITPLFLKVN